MVEYQYKDKEWKILNEHQIDFLASLNENLIKSWGIRINGVRYYERSSDFIKAVEKEIMWAKLSD